MQLSIGLTLGAQQRGRPSTITINTAPAITGTPTVGSTLTRTTGSYSGSGTVNVTNGRWTRNGADIPGATGATYTLVEADEGASIQWSELATDDESSRTVRSNTIVVLVTNLTAAGVEVQVETGGATASPAGGTLTASGVELQVESGAASINQMGLTASGAEVQVETGTATVSAVAPVMSNVSYDDVDTISLSLTEPATIFYLVDDNATRTGAQVEAGGGEASGSFAVESGANSDPVDLSGVSPGDHYLHIVAKNAAGYSTVSSTEYTFASQTLTAAGVEVLAEVGAATLSTGLVAAGVDVQIEVGAAAFVPGAWAYSGSQVTNLPDNEGWQFTGSRVDQIALAA